MDHHNTDIDPHPMCVIRVPKAPASLELELAIHGERVVVSRCMQSLTPRPACHPVACATTRITWCGSLVQ